MMGLGRPSRLLQLLLRGASPPFKTPLRHPRRTPDACSFAKRRFETPETPSPAPANDALAGDLFLPTEHHPAPNIWTRSFSGYTRQYSPRCWILAHRVAAASLRLGDRILRSGCSRLRVLQLHPTRRSPRRLETSRRRSPTSPTRCAHFIASIVEARGGMPLIPADFQIATSLPTGVITRRGLQNYTCAA